MIYEIRKKKSQTLKFTARGLQAIPSNFNVTAKTRGPVRGGLYVSRLNFKPFHVAISEVSHVAVGISSKDTAIDIGSV